MTASIFVLKTNCKARADNQLA